MTWLGLAAHAHQLQQHAGAAEGLSPRESAALVAIRAWPQQFVMENPTVVSVAALALSCGEELRVHELRAPVQTTIAETALHSLPDAAPKLLCAPCIIEVRRPSHERLWGETAALGCYERDGAHHLVGLQYPDELRVARWRPQWLGGELDGNVPLDAHSPLLTCDPDEHQVWGVEAARFLVVLGLLLEATDSPLGTIDDGPRRARTRHGKREPARAWTVRRVHLESHAADGESAGGSRGEPRSDVLPVQGQARGHLERQPPRLDGELGRWQYVGGPAVDHPR